MLGAAHICSNGMSTGWDASPHYITELPNGSLLVSSNGTNEIFKIRSARKSVELFIDTGRVGLKDIGNCVYDEQGSITPE